LVQGSFETIWLFKSKEKNLIHIVLRSGSKCNSVRISDWIEIFVGFPLRGCCVLPIIFKIFASLRSNSFFVDFCGWALNLLLDQNFTSNWKIYWTFSWITGFWMPIQENCKSKCRCRGQILDQDLWVSSRRQYLQCLPESERSTLLTGGSWSRIWQICLIKINTWSRRVEELQVLILIRQICHFILEDP
jgi:hypothetical protein